MPGFVAPDHAVLNGRWTEIGDAIWTGSTNLDIENNRIVQIASKSGDNSDNAGIRFSTNGIFGFSISADVHPNNGAWIALGVSPGPQASLQYNGHLWALLTSSGIYYLFKNIQGATLSNGTASNYSSTGFNNVELTYDIRSTYVKLVINGVTNYNSAVPGINFNSTNLNSANFQLLAQSRDAAVGQVDNFKLMMTLPPPTGSIVSFH